jgi:aminoglycoside 6'-N-acetyltransferase I
MQIRALTPNDHAEWLRMRCALWPDEDRDDLAVGEVSYAKGSAEQNRSAVFVAVRDTGGLCGMIEIGLRDVAESATTSPVGYIEGWYVDADVRKSGVGRALVERAEQWAREVGCTELGSDTELENTLSQEVHRRLGFEETQRLVTFLKRI